jgi:TP901 family phage tail tape measure protein
MAIGNADVLAFDAALRTSNLQQSASAILGTLRKVAGGISALKVASVAGFAAIGVAAIVAGRKAVAFAATLDAALREVSTLLPFTAQQLAGVRDRLVEISTRVPQPPELLTEALYQAVSAGIKDTSEALQVVEVAARAAVGGLSDTGTALKAIMTVLNAFQLPASEAARVADIFFTTVQEGVLRFEDIASTIGDFATSAALSGASIEEAAAALATMTKFGVDAQKSAVSLNRLFLSVAKASDEQREAVRKMGIEFTVTNLKAKGLVGFLKEIEDATQGDIEALAKVVPEMRSFRAVSILAGNGAGEFARILGEMERSGGASQRAFDKLSGSLQNQSQLLKNKVNALYQRLGAQILPVVIDAVESLNKAFTDDQSEVIQNLERLGRTEEALALRRRQAAEQAIKDQEALTDSIKDTTKELASVFAGRDIQQGFRPAGGAVSPFLAAGEAFSQLAAKDPLKPLTEAIVRYQSNLEAAMELGIEEALKFTNEFEEQVLILESQVELNEENKKVLTELLILNKQNTGALLLQAEVAARLSIATNEELIVFNQRLQARQRVLAIQRELGVLSEGEAKAAGDALKADAARAEISRNLILLRHRQANIPATAREPELLERLLKIDIERLGTDEDLRKGTEARIKALGEELRQREAIRLSLEEQAAGVSGLDEAAKRRLGELADEEDVIEAQRGVWEIILILIQSITGELGKSADAIKSLSERAEELRGTLQEIVTALAEQAGVITESEARLTKLAQQFIRQTQELGIDVATTPFEELDEAILKMIEDLGISKDEMDEFADAVKRLVDIDADEYIPNPRSVNSET